MGILDDIFDAGQHVVEGIDDALKDVVKQVSGSIDDLLKNVRDFTLNAFRDMLSAIWNLPKTLAKALGKMFADPQFWRAVLIFLGLVVMGNGLGAAMEAAPGARTAAMFKAIGQSYDGMHLGTINKLQRVAYMVSPKFREQFDEVWGDFAQKLDRAGVDVRLVTQLVGDVGSLVRASAAIGGKDIENFEEHWSQQVAKFGDLGADLLEQWGDNPQAMFTWFDENIVAPAHSDAAAAMNTISDTIGKVISTTDETVRRLLAVRKGLQTVAEDIDALRGTDLAERLKEGTADLDEVLTVQWRLLREQGDTLAGILETRVEEIQVDRRDDAVALIVAQGEPAANLKQASTAVLRLNIGRQLSERIT